MTTSLPGIDTLLNVFLAIAVDNLANAQELTAAEEEQQEEQQQVSFTAFDKLARCSLYILGSWKHSQHLLSVRNICSVVSGFLRE